MLKQNESHSADDKSLNEWLCYLETIHSTEIELGLSRISQVAERLHIDFSFACVITVAGTNGKGTTCAFLENAFLAEEINGQLAKVAVYSSPHIERFNERLRINKCDIDDQSLIVAFEKIELARGEISLSYYEYTTLAAFLVLMSVKPDVIILEVGLGGRLDATNIIDADVAVITTVDIDHQSFLGNDRETIGFEKAGIMRANQHIIVGDPNAPQSVLNYANKVNEHSNQASNKIKIRNKDFFKPTQPPLVNDNSHGWEWQYIEQIEGKKVEFTLNGLINCHIPQDNVVTALMVLKQLGVTLTSSKVNDVINQTRVVGRTELFQHKKTIAKNINLQCDVLLDVGHNPHAGRYLANKLVELKTNSQYKRIIAVVAMLADKDIANTLAPFNKIVDEWNTGSLEIPRAATSEQMKIELTSFSKSINCFDNITEAFKMANYKAESTDLILVFGSFFTVAEIRQLLV
jgi:dihydrofolate synthase/folylpolyglutamate synthase